MKWKKKLWWSEKKKKKNFDEVKKFIIYIMYSLHVYGCVYAICWHLPGNLKLVIEKRRRWVLTLISLLSLICEILGLFICHCCCPSSNSLSSICTILQTYINLPTKSTVDCFYTLIGWKFRLFVLIYMCISDYYSGLIGGKQLIHARTMKPGKIHTQTILTCQNISKLNKNLNCIPKLIINS